MAKFPGSTRFLALTLATFGTAMPAQAATYAPWLAQMGVSDAILSAANWGKGQLLGVVDTGIVAGNSAFAAGQVSKKLSSCAAVSFRCSNGVVDDNGHGTAVAAIAAANGRMPFTASYGGYVVTAGSVMGMAPNANIVAEKVLSAAGSGYSTDVANGVIKAANAGASVINLSLTFGNTAELVSAINYAAGKGAFIVWAGGNSATTLLGGANTNGLSAAAIAHLVLVGSVGAGNTLSRFSNTPGAGSLVNTTGTKTGYSARWVMAPGENILAPQALAGNGAFAAWSGTSMSTPLVSGSLMLLQSAWPILKTNGTTANLLLATATDLGARGVDNSYGNGLVSLATAFKPYGKLTVTQANGQAVPVASLTGAMISSGALGTFSRVKSKLSSYTSLDGYQRNFTVDLSGLIKAPSVAATVNPLPTNTNSGPKKISLQGGGELSYLAQAAQDRTATLGMAGFEPDAAPQETTAYAMLADSQRTYVALGRGADLPAPYTYTRALFDSEDAGQAAGEMAVHLSSLSQTGSLFAYATPIGAETRLGIFYSGTAAATPFAATPGEGWNSPETTSLGVGISRHIGPDVQVGLTYQTLSEKHGLLGSTYDPGSALSLGGTNRSTEFGVSMLARFGGDQSVFIEAAEAVTASATPGQDSLFAGSTGIRSRSYGISFTQRRILASADHLTVSVRQPVRVVSGTTGMAVTTIDPVTGVPSTGIERVSLVPSGRERDYKLVYGTTTKSKQKLALQAGYVKDRLNIAGNTDKSVGMQWASAF